MIIIFNKIKITNIKMSFIAKKNPESGIQTAFTSLLYIYTASVYLSQWKYVAIPPAESPEMTKSVAL